MHKREHFIAAVFINGSTEYGFCLLQMIVQVHFQQTNIVYCTITQDDKL